MTHHEKRARMRAINDRQLFPRRRIVCPDGHGRIADTHHISSKLLPVDLDAGGRVFVDPTEARLEGWWEYVQRSTPATALALIALGVVCLVALAFVVRLVVALVMWGVGIAVAVGVVRWAWLRWRG